ncbi:restriction endonuclease subunit S [Vibrio fluvialis]
MSCDLDILKVKDFVDVTDYVANGSFAALKDNVTYCDKPDYAVLVRLADHNSGWQNDLVYVDENSYKFLKKSSVQPGDVIISNVGANAGTVFRAPDLGLPMTLGPNSVLLKPKEDTPEARDFLYYFFSSPKGQHSLKSILSGSAQPKFNKTDLRNTEIVVPKGIPLAKVTGVLKSLDEKITLNLLNNQTLEEIAHSIFKSWFVDFDPVKAKMNGEQPEGMDAATASLFPEKLVESELGLIPEGWEVGALSSVVDVIMGQSPKGSTYNDQNEGTPLVNGPVEFGVYHPVAQKWTTAPTKMSKNKDLIVCVRGSTTGRYVVSDGEYCLGRGVCSIRSNDFPSFANYLFKSELNSLLHLTTGSTFPSWSGPTLKNFKVVVPPETIIEKFELLIGKLCEMMARNTGQNETLSTLRDTLLPKLLSGEIELVEQS